MANGEKSGGDSSSEEEDPNGKAAINSIATTTVLRIKPKKTNTCPNGQSGPYRRGA
ncbi:unnamed protein product [Brassica rapa subsp. trilocularis]